MLFDAHGRPVKARDSDGGHDQEDAHRTHQTADDKQTRSSPRPPIKVIVESSDTDSKQHKAEYGYSYTLQRQAVEVQWYLLIATIAAFGAAAYYAWIAKHQLATMNIQNVAQQRALLVVPEAPSYLSDGQLGIRIKNTGRLPASITQYGIWYFQKISYGQSFTRHREARPNLAIPAEAYYDIGLWMPEIPDPAKSPITHSLITGPGLWEVSISLTVDYDGGLGDQESLFFCSFFNPQTKTWGNTCLSPNSMDLTRESRDMPDDKPK